MCRWLNNKDIAQQRAFFMSRILINSCFQTSENTHGETRFEEDQDLEDYLAYFYSISSTHSLFY